MPSKEGKQLTDRTIESIAEAYNLENARAGRGGGGSKKKKKERKPDSLTSKAARNIAIEQAVQRRNEEIKQELLQVLGSLLSGFEGIQRQKTVQEYQEWLERQLFTATSTDTGNDAELSEFNPSLVLFTHDEIIVETHAKSSGPGGQNVNKVASAVRISHLPTGITVEASADRSQLRNKTQALENLKERLLQHLAQWRVFLDIPDSVQDESVRLNQIEKLRTHIGVVAAQIS